MSRYNTVAKGGGYNVATGGYGSLTANQLKNIALPDKLRCKRCNKWKKADADGMENFSKKQLAGLREKIYHSGRGKQTPIDVVCITCNSGGNCELHCAYCDTTKGLESFALAQRKNPIAPKCLICMSEQLEFDPDAMAEELNNIRRPAGELKVVTYDDDSDDDSDDGFSYEYTSDGDDNTSNVADSSAYGGDTTESGYDGSGVTGSRQISASLDTLNISTSSGGVQLSERHSDLSTWQTATGGRARKAAPSSTVVNGSNSSYSANVQVNKTGFAKIRAYKAPTERNTPMPEQSKKASKCTNSDWDSEEDEEEHGSIATTRATGQTQATGQTRATLDDLDDLDEHEITWDSDDSSDHGLDYDSDDE
ncbi:hypothetical protein BLS_004071 [Venturia inaequalis]|nr:hypothetical protein BLS_004071 [Venturia inaequalis]KAE9988391.1 hypothetical protein EG328_011151 [Venturia inaequalis]RDI82116.1 hypothetical protein Vi05172_g7823 [Venturia inaequalis]